MNCFFGILLNPPLSKTKWFVPSDEGNKLFETNVFMNLIANYSVTEKKRLPVVISVSHCQHDFQVAVRSNFGNYIVYSELIDALVQPLFHSFDEEEKAES